MALVNHNYPEYSKGLEQLIDCESKFNNAAVGDNGKARGILQFHYGTFLRYSSYGDYLDPEAQLHTAVKMIRMGIGPTTGGWYNCWRERNLYQYF